MQQPTGKGTGNGQVQEDAGRKTVDGKAFAKAKAEPVEDKVERLIRWLHSPMEKMPYIAIQELQGAGRERMPSLLEALSHSDCSIRANAALILAESGGRWALRVLKKRLNDPSPAVCAIVEMAICEIVKRHFKEMDPKSVETIAARLGGRHGRELDRLLGKDVPEPPRSRSEDEDI